MNLRNSLAVLSMLSVTMIAMSLSACGGAEGPPQPPPPPPPEYADKHMPPDYWNNPAIIEEGRQIFTGAKNIDVNCASCHGKDGKPVKAGARDFRQTEHMKLFSDSQWFWRVSEGVKGTKMKPWKEKLSEDDRWKVIAYESTFGMNGMKYDPVANAWVSASAAPAEPVAAEPVATEPAAESTASTN